MRDKSNYVFGLDVFRSIAILSVVAGHSLGNSKPPEWIAHFGRVGGVGVELFFVLSGFLIGGIILKLIAQQRFHTVGHVMDFWKRRWLRTLPLYVVAYFAFLRFDGRHGLLDFPQFMIFLQNFAWPIPKFFILSWSLAVEEHFYLLFPVSYLVAHAITRRPGISLGISVLFFMALVFGYRLSRPFFQNWDDFNYASRMVVMSRFDAIMAGVVIAAIKRYSQGWYTMLRRLTPLWAFLTLVICTWHYLSVPGLLGHRSLQVFFFFTGESMVFACLLPWFDSLKEKPATVGGKFFAMTSTLSYSMYLGHILVIMAINSVLTRTGLYEAIYYRPLIIYPLYFSGYYGLAWFTYTFIEKPFLQIRDQSVSWPHMVRLAWVPCVALICFIFLA